MVSFEPQLALIQSDLRLHHLSRLSTCSNRSEEPHPHPTSPLPRPNVPPQLDPSTQFAQELHEHVARIKKAYSNDLAIKATLSAPVVIYQTQSFSRQVSRFLTHPIETRLGTCTVGTAIIHTGVIWTLCCRSNWVAKMGTEWMNLSNGPVRALVFVGMTAHYLDPPVQKRDVRWYLHKANRFFKSLG